jgi:uncharacterized protein with HEPN domain
VFSDHVRTRLGHVVEYGTRISSYTEGLDFAAFRADELRVLAVERCLQNIAEAVIQIGEEEVERIMPGIPFKLIRGMGNRLRHEYKGIDALAVYDTVHDELPELIEAAAAALARHAR